MSHMPGTSQVPGMSRGRLCGCLRSQRGPDPGGVIRVHLLEVPQLALDDGFRHTLHRGGDTPSAGTGCQLTLLRRPVRSPRRR